MQRSKRMNVAEFLLSLLGSRVMDALERASRAATDEPNLPQSWIRLGRELVEAGALAPARQVLLRARACEPEGAEQWKALGLLLLRASDPSEALEALRAAAVLAPEDVETARGYAQAALEIGAAEEARGALRRALKTHDDPELRAMLERAEQPPTPRSSPQLSGDLTLFKLPEFIEFIGLQRATGELSIRSGDRRGVVRIERGRLCDVEVPDAPLPDAAKPRLIEGLRALMAWSDGSLHFTSRSSVEDACVSFDHQEILMEVMKALDDDLR